MRVWGCEVLDEDLLTGFGALQGTFIGLLGLYGTGR